MGTSILKWGNSQGVRLTMDMLRAAKIGVSEPVVIKAEPGRIVIEKARPRIFLADLLAKIPAGTQFELVDYGVPQGNESP